MLLRDWMERHGVSDDDLAARIGRHRTDCFRYRRGQHVPRAEVIIAIERETNGEVTAEDLLAAYMERRQLKAA